MQHTPDSSAHCKITTGTQSMCFNAVSNRFSSTSAMNYTNRVINNIDLRTDTVRLSFISISGVDQAVQGTSGNNWTNIFTTTDGIGIYPSISTFNPNMSSSWDTSTVNAPVYLGDSQIISLYGHVVFKQADGVQDSNNVQLSLWTQKPATVAVPAPVWTMLLETTPGSNISDLMAIAIADKANGTNKASTSMTVNIVIPVVKGEGIQLRIRNAGSSPVNYKYFQTDLFCRPIELHGTDKNV